MRLNTHFRIMVNNDGDEPRECPLMGKTMAAKWHAEHPSGLDPSRHDLQIFARSRLFELDYAAPTYYTVERLDGITNKWEVVI